MIVSWSFDDEVNEDAIKQLPLDIMNDLLSAFQEQELLEKKKEKS